MTGTASWLWVVPYLLGLRRPGKVPTERIPKALKKRVSDSFKPTPEPSWIVRVGTFQAIMVENYRFKSVSFNLFGRVRNMVNEVDPVEVPPPVQNFILTHFPGWNLRKAYEIVDPKGRHYRIDMRKGLVVKQLHFYADGALKHQSTSSVVS